MDIASHPKLQNLALLFVRLVVAAIFLFAGWAKLIFWSTDGSGISPLLGDLFRILSVCEPLGALALILGLLTRWAASGLAIIMVGAILVLHFTVGSPFFTTPQGLGFDYNLLILGSCLMLMVFGAGRWSADEMKKNYKKSFEE